MLGNLKQLSASAKLHLVRDFLNSMPILARVLSNLFFLYWNLNSKCIFFYRVRIKWSASMEAHVFLDEQADVALNSGIVTERVSLQ